MGITVTSHDRGLTQMSSNQMQSSMYFLSIRELGKTPPTSPLGMHHPLGDPLPIEVGHLVGEDHILDQHGAPQPGRH